MTSVGSMEENIETSPHVGNATMTDQPQNKTPSPGNYSGRNPELTREGPSLDQIRDELLMRVRLAWWNFPDTSASRELINQQLSMMSAVREENDARWDRVIKVIRGSKSGPQGWSE